MPFDSGFDSDPAVGVAGEANVNANKVKNWQKWEAMKRKKAVLKARLVSGGYACGRMGARGPIIETKERARILC